MLPPQKFDKLNQNKAKHKTMSFPNFLNFRNTVKGLCTCTPLAKSPSMLNLSTCIHAAKLAGEKDKTVGTGLPHRKSSA